VSGRGPLRSPVRTGALVAAVLWLANLHRWARRTRPEPLPAPPHGSTTVLAEDGTPLHAQVTGCAQADVSMLFVHGFLARSIAFDHQVTAFAGTTRVIRYDHRNHGRSGRTSRPIDVQTLAADLACVIEQLAPAGPVVLVGHSMGGMTALALALERPDLFRERVAGVGLIATGAGHYVDGHPVENAFRWISRRHLLVLHLLGFRLLAPVLEQLRPRRTPVMRAATRRIMFGADDVDPATLAMTHELLEEPALSTLASLQGALLRHEVLPALEALRDTPVAIVTGADDVLIRPEHSRRMAADIGPAAELVVVPGAGHVVNQTRPLETNAALLRLLERVRAGLPSVRSAA
jgi:pimeloyl-ACP methyl ester carboxylesterase